MSSKDSSPFLSVADGIQWVKEVTVILVVDETGGRSWELHGFEAMLWDLLMLGYTWQRLQEVFGALFMETPGQVDARLISCLRAWLSKGLLISSRKTHG